MGMPRELDLEGRDAVEAEKTWRQLLFDYPGFELEAGSITLAEIQRRAKAFDPLSMEVDPEIRAISANGWESLGVAGLVLHLFRSRRAAGEGRLTRIEVLSRGRGKDKWHVLIDGRKVAGFSKVAQAVEATDFEVHRMGKVALVTALPEAAWRQEPVPEDLAAKLADLRRPRRADTWGEALRLWGFEVHARALRKTRRRRLNGFRSESEARVGLGAGLPRAAGGVGVVHLDHAESVDLAGGHAVPAVAAARRIDQAVGVLEFQGVEGSCGDRDAFRADDLEGSRHVPQTEVDAS